MVLELLASGMTVEDVLVELDHDRLVVHEDR